MPDKQFMLFLDDVRLPADALIGEEDAALAQLFAGLNPERIMAAAGSVGMGRYALDKAVAYANEREVWGKPIGTHQGLAHPLAKCKVELELAQADDAEGRLALRQRRRHGRRRGGEHGEVRGGRGEHRLRRPGRADARRQRPRARVRPGQPADRCPRRAHRAGQPRDDPQLRRPVQPRPAEERTDGRPLRGRARRSRRSPSTPRQPQRAVEAARRARVDEHLRPRRPPTTPCARSSSPTPDGRSAPAPI